MSIRTGTTLQLIAPLQVKLTQPVEVNLNQFAPGDIVTLEKHQAINLVRKGKAEALNDGVDPARSANHYRVKEAVKPSLKRETVEAPKEGVEEAPEKGKERK